MTNSMLFRRVGTVISLLLGLALIRFGLNSERFASSPVWGGLIFLVRARWGVLTFLGPTLITIAALTVTRNLLFPVLVTRSSVSRTGIDPWTGWRFPRLFVDLVLVTWLSLLMVVLGIAIIHTVWLHGEERFGSPHDLLFPKGSVADQDHPGTEVSANAKTPAETKPISWTGFHFSAWLGFGLVLPFAMLWISAREHSLRIPMLPGSTFQRSPLSCLSNWIWGLAGLLLGVVAAALVLFILSVLQRAIFGSASLQGLLPFDSWLRHHQPDWPELSFAVWIRGLIGGIFPGPGYRDLDGRLYPAHGEMAAASSVALATYICWWVTGHTDRDWANSRWPSAFYLLLLMTFLGVQLGGASFCLDRFGMPPSAVILIWVFVVYWIVGADNFYATNPILTDGESKMRDARLAERQKESNEGTGKSLESDSPLGLKLAMARAEGTAETSERLTWREALQNWNFPRVGTNGERTLVVVTASGGGIQASAWTAKVLTELDQYEGFSESVGMISAVSGGSVGAMFYLCHREHRKNDAQLKQSMVVPDLQQGRIMLSACGPALEAVSWGVAFPDLLRAFLPAVVDKYEDRGWALESACWNRLGPSVPDQDDGARLLQARDRYLMADLRLRDFIAPFNKGELPAVIFNATSVETGQRVLFSTVDLRRQAGIGNEDNKTPQQAAEMVVNPIDWYSLYPEGDPRLTTAVRLSASFSFVAPVARSDASHSREELMHLCDGGYASNSGLVTAIRAIDRLLEEASGDFKALPFDRVLIVSIAPYAATTANLREGGNGFVVQATGPQKALANVRVSSQAERDQLELGLLLKKYANWENATPVSAVTLQFDMPQTTKEGKAKSASPPLSWNLVPSAALAIDEAWDKIATPKASAEGPIPSIRPTRVGFELIQEDATATVKARGEEIMLDSLADLERFFPKRSAPAAVVPKE